MQFELWFFLLIFDDWLLASVWHLRFSHASLFNCDLQQFLISVIELHSIEHSCTYGAASKHSIICANLGKRRKYFPLLFTSGLWCTNNSPTNCFTSFFFISWQDKLGLWGPGWQIDAATKKPRRKFSIVLMGQWGCLEPPGDTWCRTLTFQLWKCNRLLNLKEIAH